MIFSHSSPRALCDHPRNIPDDLIAACADQGGVVGVTGVGLFLTLDGADVSTGRMVAQIEHVAEVGGVDHVGIGMDVVYDTRELQRELAERAALFPDTGGYRAGILFAEPEQLPAIAVALLDRGWPRTDVAKVMGGNFRRIAAQVWR